MAARFNGATAFRRWERSNRSVPVIALLVLQWGHRLSAMEASLTSNVPMSVQACFNGATAFRRWKPPCSSGPAARRHSFNGATAFQRWKHHRLHLSVLKAVAASMGPPPFGDGSLIMEPILSDIEPLQWGHRLSAMEARRSPSGPSSCGCFNGATAFRRWKPVVWGMTDREYCASMGPPPFGDGSGHLEGLRHLLREASMGPPPFGDGSRNGGERDAHPLLASMGPPPFGDGSGSNWKCTLSISRSLQWGHRLSAMEACRGWLPFSGEVLMASMGPPPFGDGSSFA